jgi:hypothetical protein
MSRRTEVTPCASVVQTHERPVVGHAFTGLRISDLGAGIISIRCGGEIAGKRLRARQAWNPKGFFTCSWRIPAGSAGKSGQFAWTVAG